MICLSCTGSTLEKDLELIKENLEYIDLAEIRVDFLKPQEFIRLALFPEEAGLPCILTFRRLEDGGQNPGINSEERCKILSAALAGGWSYLDIEDDADTAGEQQLVKTAEAEGIRVIKSFHDFTGVPENLAKRMFDNSCGDRFIPKAAVMPRSSSDFIKIVDTFRELSDLKFKSAGYSCINGPLLTDFILVGMGEAGFPTRIMAGAWGGLLSFCSAGQVKAAPGHVSPRELVETYNCRNLNSETRVFGIIGNPVMHTKSPELHNAAFKTQGIDAVYLPFETDDPGVIIKNAEKLKLDGLSVTVPYKKAVIAEADTVDPAVTGIGACNTLIRNNGWRGYNTDWKGFLAPLEASELQGRAELQGQSAIVIGAGGAARAVIYALKSAGMDVTILNRTIEKAEALAEAFGCRAAGINEAAELCRGTRKYKLVVQTTSAGMSPDIDGNPVPDFDFTNIEIAYDIIYAPEQTVFLRNAAAAGCKTINGFPMLKAQAAEQFFLFTGCKMS